MRSRISPGTLLAALALFVALGGTGYAAAKITSKDVKNGSLTGRDIKNRSIGSADVRDRSLRARDFRAGELPAAGTPGPAGPKGDQGAAGPQGERGPSDGFHARFPGNRLVPDSASSIAVIELPEGDYVLTVTGSYDNEGAAAARVTCDLDTGELAFASQQVRLGLSESASSEQALAITARARGGRRGLICTDSGGAVNIDDLSFTAIRVGTLTDVGPPPGNM